MTRLHRFIDMLFLLAAIVVGLMLCDALDAAIARAQSDQATITIRTDGTTSTVETYGGDLGYPGPSSVEYIYDDLGVVLVTRVRLFDQRETWVFVPWVSR